MGRNGADAVPESGDRIRVLVVDDEANITDLVATALRYEGFDVSTAGDGTDRLSLVESFRPRPDRARRDAPRPRRLRGPAAARRTVAQRVPVVFLTARDATEDKVHGLTLGGDDYVTKPFSLEELIARIRTVLRRAGGIDGGERTAPVRGPRDGRGDARGLARRRAIELTPTEFALLRLLL